MPEAVVAPSTATNTPPAPAKAAPPKAVPTSAPAEAEGADTAAAAKKSDDVDPKDLWRKAVKGRTIKHKGAEKALEELDPDEAAEYIRRGYGASELVAEAKKKSAEADSILAIKKAIAEGDDDAALDAIMEIGGERGLKLLDKLRTQIAEREKETESLTEKERAAMERAQAAEERAAALERAQQKRQQEENEKTEKAELAKTRTEGLSKVNEVLKTVKGFPAEKAELILPFVVRAWREAIETGAELGRDVSGEAIVKRAEKLFRGSTSDFYGQLSPEEQFEFLGEAAVEKLSNELVRRRRGGAARAAVKPAPSSTKKPEAEAISLGDPRYLRR